MNEYEKKVKERMRELRAAFGYGPGCEGGATVKGIKVNEDGDVVDEETEALVYPENGCAEYEEMD